MKESAFHLSDKCHALYTFLCKFFCKLSAVLQNIHDMSGNQPYFVNSLASGRCNCYPRLFNFKLTLGINVLSISCKITLRCMPQDLTDDSTLIQVMTWCCQATSHYMWQCWPRSLSPYMVSLGHNVSMLFNCDVMSFFYFQQMGLYGWVPSFYCYFYHSHRCGAWSHTEINTPTRCYIRAGCPSLGPWS